MSNQSAPDNTNNNSSKPRGNNVIKRIIIFAILCLLVGFIIFSVLAFRKNYEKVIVTRYDLNTRVLYNPFYAAEMLLNSQYDQSNGLMIDDSQDYYDQGSEDAAYYDAEYDESYDAEYDESYDEEYDDDYEDDYYDYQFATTLLDSSFKNLIEDLPYIDYDLVNNEGVRPTLIINSIGSNLTDENFEQLQQWIIDGGHLITFSNDWTDFDTMSDVDNRLDELNSLNASSEEIAADDKLNELLADIDTADSFLAKLGIYAVNKESLDEDNQLDEQFEALFEEMEEASAQDKSTDADDDSDYNESIRQLYSSQPLSIMPINSRTNDSKATDSIAVITEHGGKRLHSKLFEILYADKINNTYTSDSTKNNSKQSSLSKDNDKQNLNLIKAYLRNQKKSVLKQINDHKQSTDNDETTKDKEQKLFLLINAMQELDDEMLLALFKPIEDVYLDYELGDGRLSVIVGSDTFSNPDPNSVLPLRKVGVDTGEVIEGNIPLAPHITAQSLLKSYYYNVTLYDANNAAWLTYLTQNSEMVWILPNTDVEPLPKMLWKQARFAVLGLGLLLLIWLWSLYNRFGKLQTLSQTQSYDILNYFRQVGRFGWQQDNAAMLTGVAREKAKALAVDALRYRAPNTDSGSHNSSGYDINHSIDPDSTFIDLSSAKNSMALHKILLSCLREKKQLEQEQSIAGFASNNYADIIELIAPSKLRQALAPSVQAYERADEFTDMTQTLWIIEWLLK